MGPRYLKTDGRFVYIWEYSLSLFPSENPGVMELLNVFNMTLIGYFFEVSILMTFWICMKNPGSLNSFITAATWEDWHLVRNVLGISDIYQRIFNYQKSWLLFPDIFISSALFTAAVFWMSLEKIFPCLLMWNMNMSGQPLIRRKKGCMPIMIISWLLNMVILYQKALWYCQRTINMVHGLDTWVLLRVHYVFVL